MALTIMQIKKNLEENAGISISLTHLMIWLAGKGLIRIETFSNSSRIKIACITRQGLASGIFPETKLCKSGEYTAYMFDEQAQKLIIDGLKTLSERR